MEPTGPQHTETNNAEVLELTEWADSFRGLCRPTLARSQTVHTQDLTTQY